MQVRSADKKATPVLSEPGLWSIVPVEYPEVSHTNKHEVEGKCQQHVVSFQLENKREACASRPCWPLKRPTVPVVEPTTDAVVGLKYNLSTPRVSPVAGKDPEQFSVSVGPNWTDTETFSVRKAADKYVNR